MKFFFIFTVLLFLAVPSRAQTPSFQMPLDCKPGENCWVVNHVDVDPSETAQDFRCGSLTYNDHHGTDFGITDQVTMETGIDVLAAADGKVLRARDKIEDKIVSAEERVKMLAENRGCGNGVFIDHGAGWQTIYCHMKKGSVTAKPNQKIKAGQKIGEIGLSGIAEFPHVHFGVFFEGNTIDPFTGAGDQKGCGFIKAPLWNTALNLEYEPVSIYAAGFKAGVPDFDAVKIDTTSPSTIAANSIALTFWGALYGVAKGDQIHIEIRDPAGRTFAQRDITQEKDRARQFYFIGRKVHDKGLEKGTYTGHVQITRSHPNSAAIERQKSRTLVVE